MRVRLVLPALVCLSWTAQGQDPNAPEARFAQAARASLDAGREAAGKRLRQAREAVAADAREESERDARFAGALRESTTKVPLRVSLPDNLVLDNVRISDYAAGLITFAWPKGEVIYPVAQLPEDTRATIVAIALSKGTARDHFELGRLLLRAKDYERAGRCFATAVQRDPALAASVPDVERLRRVSRLFEGQFRLSGNNLSLRWSFGSADEAGDFQALEGTLAVQPGAGLALNGPTLALAAIKEIPFHNRVRLSTLPRETDAAAHLMGIRFVKPDGGVVVIYGALATAAKTFTVVRSEDGTTKELLAPTAGAAGNRMTMEYNRGRVTFLVGERGVWSGSEGGFTDVLAVVGSVVMSKGTRAAGAAAFFKEVSLQGDVNPLWISKKTAAFRDAFAAEFSKEDRALRRDGPGVLSLSVDTGLSLAPPIHVDAYKAALKKVSAMRASQKQEDLDEALTAIEGVTVAYPTFAPAWYYRGELEELSGGLTFAEACYDHALRMLPEFPEALCGKGRLRALAGKWREAGDLADQAMTLKPDLADVHVLQARLFWNLRDADSTIEAARMARKLAPADPEIQTTAQQLVNVARGPRWAKPSVQDTAHYSVRSDLPPAKCRKYAEHLEAMRPHYEEVLGRKLPPGKPATVLIFESEEGYFVYSDYTVGSRLEHTLGAFSPWHGQLALFEGLDVQETTRVLSHEGFHQALHAVASDVPTWFNEGMAEYVGAARVENGSIVERGGVQAGRLENLTGAVKYGWQPVPFSRIMLESQAQFYGPEAALKYAQAWSMVRYFLDGDGGKWKPLFKDYTARLLKGDGAQAAYDETFAKQDLAQLEAGWLKQYGLFVRKKPAAEAAVDTAPVDLMAALVAKGVKATSGWILRGDQLFSLPLSRGSLELGLVPPAEYDWRLTIERRGGTGPLNFGLLGGGSTFVLKLDDFGRSRLEALEGPDRGNPPSARNAPVLESGKLLPVVVSVRKAAVFVSVDGETVLDWKGQLRRLSYAPGAGMPPQIKSLFLQAAENGDFRITEMSVSAAIPAVVAAGPAAPDIAVDPARSIPLDAELRAWLPDDDGAQILAVDAAGTLLQISTTEKKILRKIVVPPGSSCLFPGGGKSVWVGDKDAGGIVRVDLDKGQVVETIPVAVPAQALVVLHKLACCLAADGSFVVVDLAEKRELGPVGNGFSAIAYEARKDRVWGYGMGVLTEYDGSKLGGPLKELARKNLTNKERGELTTVINTLGKRHPLSGASGDRVLMDNVGGRLYVGGLSLRPDKPETPLGVFRPGQHPLDAHPGVRAFLARAATRDQILAVSGDGKSAASSSFIFNAATFSIRREIPLPTSMVALSKDGKDLFCYDWANKVIALVGVEGK